jgi:serine/threonine-protein kinase
LEVHLCSPRKRCVTLAQQGTKDDQMKVCPVCSKEYSDTTTLCPADAEVLQSVDDPLVGQTLAGKYLVEQLIKRGGMGAVYRGKHVMMDKTVAIKVLRPSLAGDDDVVARFSREAKAASRISHPHAVSVTDFGEAENGVVFLVMEYLDGRTLKDIIRSEGPIPLSRAVEITRQVSGALDAAHKEGVVHRDLKSDNIMLSQTNGGDWAKVLDFGIAKIQQPEGVRDHDITAANLVLGTPQYMSPEQCSQTGPIDARSDVYSLGVIVYEMLAGRVPFTGESPTVIMMKQVQDPPPSILEARPDLPASVDKLIERALAKQPVDRFQTAGDLSEALTQAAADAGDSVSVTPPVAETVSNAPVSVTSDDLDEVTVVQPRDEVTVVQARHEPPLSARQAGDQSSLANFNLWRIMVPAAIVLVAVFGVVFLLTRGTSQTPTNQTPGQTPGQTGLAADPNSQPVRATGTPTGESERGIQPTSTVSPGKPNANANANASQGLPPSTVPENSGSNDNENTSGSNSKNANQGESPTPKSTPSVVKAEQPPPPRAMPSLKPSPKPSATQPR